MDDAQREDRVQPGFVARRVRMPSSGLESWTVVGRDGRAAEMIDEFLGWLTGIERSPNTVEAYARDLGLFWSFLGGRGLAWDRVSVVELGEFAAWARRPAENVLALSEQAAKRSASTVNRMLAAVVSFYEFQGRRGNELARDLRAMKPAGLLRRQLTPIEPLVKQVEAAGLLDPPAKCVGRTVRDLLSREPLKDLLSGTWLGHVMHPMLTGVVVGSFMSDTVLELLGGDRSGEAQRR